MEYRRILTIQDISCVGQCSLTVALPLLSACGLETCVLPSAVLSTHTGGFSGYTFRDLTEDIPAIQAHWQKEGISFDGVYTGYLGSARQIVYVKAILETMVRPGGLRIVDPAMADNGRLYAGFDLSFVETMKHLCGAADVIVPNLTEACFLTGTPYRERYDEAYISELLKKLAELNAGTVVLTGVGYVPDRTGVMVYQNGEKRYYSHRRIDRVSHGTGDVFASIFAGACVGGWDVFAAARLAADMTLRSIESTLDDPDHWYGVKFEKMIPALVKAVRAAPQREREE